MTALGNRNHVPRGPRRAAAWAGAATWVAIALAALLPYVNTLRADFTFDDGGLILENPHVAPQASWTDSLVRPYWHDHSRAGLYRPVAAFTYRLQREFGDDPAPFHLLNLLLHAGVSLLVLAVLRRLAPGRPGLAFATALLFAVHPLHTEAVTNVIGRAELLAAGFGLGGYLFWLRAQNGTAGIRPGTALAAGLCFALSAGSKESALAWVLLLGLHRLIPFLPEPGDKGTYASLRKSGRWKGAIALDAAAGTGFLAYLVARRLVLGSFLGIAGAGFVENPLFRAPLGTRLLTASKVLWKGIGLHFWPAELNPDYSYDSIPLESAWLSVAGLLALLGLGITVAAVVVAVRAARRHPPASGARLLSWSVLFYAAMILPTANLLAPVGTIMAERLLYLPSLGLFTGVLILALAAWNRLAPGSSRSRRAGPVLLAALLVPLAVRTWDRNEDWRSNATLFREAVRTQPRSAKVRINLGSVLTEEGDWRAAEEQYRAALAVSPGYIPALNGLGHSLIQQRRYAEAEAAFREVLERSPEEPRETLVRLGNLLLEIGRPAEALPLFERAVSLAGDHADGWIGRASALFLLERYRASAEAWDEAVRRQSAGEDLRRHAAAAWLRAGERDRSIALLREAAAAHPEDAGLLHSLARLLLEGGAADEAAEPARRAAERDPRFEHLETWLSCLVALGHCEQARAVLTSPAFTALEETERGALSTRIAEACGSADPAAQGTRETAGDS